jgi:hypothetical protein
VNADSNKAAMEEALAAAVKRMKANGSTGPMGHGAEANGMNGMNGMNGASGTSGMMNGATDPMSMLMSFLPKLLQGNDERDEVADKLESLQKEELAPMREQVQVLHRQLHRVLKTQELVLAELRELRKQQSAVTHAVIDLAGQMARVEIVQEFIEEPEDFHRGTSAASSGQARTRTQNDYGKSEPKPARK